MRYLLIVSVAASVAFLVAAGGSSAQRSAGLTAGSTTGQYIVVLKDRVDVDAKIAQLGVQTSHRYYYALRGFAARLSAAQLDALRADPSVASVGVDRVVQADAVIKPGEIVPPGIRRIESAVGNQIKKKSIVNVAIIDTGIDLNHTDLKAVAGRDCTGPEPPQDDNGHGTHVAGTVAATNKGAGVVGISPGTKVYAVKVLTAAGSGSDATIICGIDWVRQNTNSLRIKVANMSLSRTGTDNGNCGPDALHQAVCNAAAAGVTFTVSAGNTGANISTRVPAGYDEVLTSSAMADTDGRPGGLGPSCSGVLDDSFASFSGWATPGSADEAHLAAAPGVCVLSTRLGGGTTVMSGTSMSAPHNAGTVANCIGHKNAPGPCSGMTPAQIIVKIRADAAAKPPSYGFNGDPNHAPPPGRSYSLLVSNSGY